jgi:23S rRNA (guanosine2251-2'-O)-methyltransferase
MQEDQSLIFGRNAVLEALKSDRATDTLYHMNDETAASLGAIFAQCKKRGVVCKSVDKRKLDNLTQGAAHQGVVLLVAAREYVELDELFAAAEARGEDPFFLICDEIEDPHNLGAILRTAEAAGAHGVIVPKRRNAPLSMAVSKASAGAVEYIPVARVPNLSAAIQTLQSRGVWVYGAAMDGTACYDMNLRGPIALVIGSEGKGIGRLVLEHCDTRVSLPMRGKINSLNASVAAGILMYEIARQRAEGGC